jgi:hypothetical protein
MEQFNRMAGEAGLIRRKPRDERAGQSALARSPKRADDPSRVAVTRKAFDVARYITIMTTQLEAEAIRARLDQLAYLLAMAKLESEIIARMYFGPRAERADEKSDEPAVGRQRESSWFD